MAPTLIKRNDFKFSKGGTNPGKDTGPETKTEPEYMPAHVQISRLIRAGENLAVYRKEMFDIGWENESKDIPLDPTRGSNYDLADAQEDLVNIARRGKPIPMDETEENNDSETKPTVKASENESEVSE